MSDHKIPGSEALIRSLIAEGVDTVFGYPGGSIINVYDRLYDYQDQIRHILARHEQGAIHAAQGYARATGRTGVVIATSGPGATNLVTGIGDALMDSTPLVVITGQVASSVLGTDAFQEIDMVDIANPITKWALQVRRAADIPSAIARAFYIANSGRPGPVLIDIAKDAQQGLTEWHHEKCDYIRTYCARPALDYHSLSQVAGIINSAVRPLILSGHGVMIAGAEPQLRELAEKAEIPVASTLLGLSTLPSSHPLFRGMLGMHGNIAPNVATNRADVIIAVGMRFDDRVTGRLDAYAPSARIIHIDIDASEFNKNVRANCTIHGDAREVLTALLPLVHPARHPEWLASFDRLDAIEKTEVIDRQTHPASGPILMGEVVDQVSTATSDDAILVTDVGQNQMLAARYFRFSSPRSIITSGGLGTMGFSLPAAIGAKIGCPDRQVCAFAGDGGIQMTLQELGTIMAYNIPVKIIVLNNSFLGNVRQWQELFFNARYSQTPMTNPDFVTLASAYGIPGEHVSDRADLPDAISRMVKSPTAYLLEVDIHKTDNIFPMMPLGAAVDELMLNATDRLDLSSL